MSKQLVGQAKRNADIEAARAISAKTDDKGLLSDSSKTVTQEKKKATVKKPTAEALGVGAVVGSRGKVRSENPINLPPIPDAHVTQDDLNCYWTESTTHHAPEGYSLMRDIEMKTGQPWWTNAEKGETLHAYVIRAIKTLANPKPTLFPYAAEKITREETPTKIILRGSVAATLKPTAAAPMKVSKPRADGWKGLSSSAIFRWCGSQGWTKEECIKAIACIGLQGVQQKSLPTLIKAGKDGFRLPEMPSDAADELNRCVGRIQVASKSKK